MTPHPPEHPPAPGLPEREIRIYLGRTGWGKSFRLKRDLLARPRLIVYDSLNEPTWDCFRRIDNPGELISLLIRNPSFFQVSYSTKQARLGFRLTDDLELISQCIFCCQNLVFAVEEIGLFSSPNYLPVGIENVAARGRKKRLSLFVTSQRAAMIHPLIRSQASSIISFGQHEPADLDWLKKRIGPDGEAVRKLRPYQALTWSARNGISIDKLPESGGSSPVIAETPGDRDSGMGSLSDLRGETPGEQPDGI